MQTKSILFLSLSLNVVLVVAGAIELTSSYESAVPAAEPAPRAALSQQIQNPSEGNPVTAPAERFQWSQLWANDDAVYAQNLRVIGCPESTIRDIITAGIARRFDQKRQEIATANKEGRIDNVTMQMAIAQSWQDQNHVVNGFPGGTRMEASRTSSSSAPTTSASSARSSGGGPVAAAGAPLTMRGASSNGNLSADPGVRMPLALSDPPESLGLSEAQKSAVVQVGNDFSQAVAKSNLDPSDPAYHQLWQDSQRDADDLLRTKIGQDAYVKWQLQNRRPTGK